MSIALQAQVDRLEKRVEELEKLVEQLTAAVTQPKVAQPAKVAKNG